MLAHPVGPAPAAPAPATRIVLHASLATFTLAFTALHVVVHDPRPVGAGALAGHAPPDGVPYPAVPVTLGVLVLGGPRHRGDGAVGPAGSAAPGCRCTGVALAVSALVWAHGVLAGSDASALRGFYLATGPAVAGLAVSRYGARTPRELAGVDVEGAMTPPTAAPLAFSPPPPRASRRHGSPATTVRASTSSPPT